MHRYKKLSICKESVAPIAANGNTVSATIGADAKETVMKQFIVAAAGLTAGALIAFAPPAGAGCQYGGGLVEKMCDEPVRDDGTWKRCVTQHTQDVINRTNCQMMGPGQNPLGLAYYNPPTHIDD